MPAAIVAAGGRFGVKVGDWEKAGLWRATYRDVTCAFPGATITIGELTAPVFAVWPRLEGGPTIESSDVTVVIEPQTPPRPRPERPGTSAHQIVSTVERVWPEARRRLPPAVIERARVEAGSLRIDVGSLRWDGETLRAEGSVPRLDSAATAAMTRRDGGAFVFNVSIPEREAALEAVVAHDGDAVDVAARATWEANVADATATFGTEGLLPSSASVRAPELQAPAELAGLSGYGPIDGGVTLEWDGARYAGEAHARATPIDAGAGLPPLAVDVRAAGDFEQVRVEAVNLAAPGLDARLSSPLEWRFDAGIPATAARFTLALDVGELPWIEGTGAVEGTADVARAEAGEPVVDFQLRGRDLGWRRLAGGAFSVAGQWAPPLLTISELSASIDEATTLEASGAADLRARAIERAELRMSAGPDAARAWFPDAPGFAGADLVATAGGSFDKPAYDATLELRDLEDVPGGAARLDLHVTGAGIETADVDAKLTSAAGATIPLRAAIARGPSGAIGIDLQTLRWEDAAGVWWSLERPVAVSIAAPAGSGGMPEVTLGRADLKGEMFSLAAAGSVRWPAEGRASIEAAKIEGRRLQPYLPDGYSDIFVEALGLDANWADGPVALDGSTRVRYSPREDASYAVEAAFRSGDDSSSLLADLNIEAESGVVLSGSGRVPLTLTGRATGFSAQLPADGALALDLASQPNPVFWQSIAGLTGWAVNDPVLRASLTGTLGAPRGEVDFSAGQLLPPTKNAGAAQLPRLSDMSVRIVADDEGLKLTEALVAVEDKWIRLTGSAPWWTWRTLKEQKRFDWREASFELASNPLPVAIAARVFPTALAPDGEVSIDVHHTPAEGLGGHVWLHGAALRPLPPVGAIREINAELVFNNYDVRLPALTALIGGRPVEISGRGRVQPGEPVDFELQARSERVPVVRAAGLVVRAGLDVRVSQRGNEPGRISGEVSLGPSVYVSEFVSLIPTGGVTAPEQRPPFFSVKEEPFGSWTLDVAVKGDEFLRVENPLFKGLLSADFRLEGTLAEPKAIGQITSSKGAIVFPFASMALTNLELTLSRENPYEPRILATAGTRVFGYDLRMEVTGSASDPRLQFSANPPLSSQEVFLMVTAGALPDDTRSFSTSERARRLAFYLGKNLASDFGIGGGGAGGERLTVRSGENFTREGRETVYVQYDLDKRWSAVGEYDRFDAYNGGIKFRLIDR